LSIWEFWRCFWCCWLSGNAGGRRLKRQRVHNGAGGDYH